MLNLLRSLTEEKAVKLLSLAFFIILLVLLFASSTTTDEGDSLMHFLYAKYAFRYPAHFFNQWAKPVYVMVMAPFAQFGFAAVQLVNIFFTTANFYVVYRVAKQAGIPNAWMASLIYAATPLSVLVSFSGLTEPMFAFATLLSILLLQQKKFYFSLLLFSFLPFIRSEGLLVCGVIFIYLLVIEKYDLIPLLLFGHIFYSLTGYFVHHDLMWVFNKLSYATLSSAYGSGRWFHFFNVMSEITGVVVKYLLWAGVFYGFILLIRALRKKINETEQQELWLLYGIFLAVFAGHIVFWALGIFNSMGLVRPIAGITPLIAIIALRGIQYVTASIQQWKAGLYVQYLLLAAVLVFPFTSNVYAYKWNRDFELKADQQAQLQLVKYIKQHYPNYNQQIMYHVLPWISIQLKQDWFNPNQHIHINDAFTRNQFKKGELFIWDDWFAVVEGHAPLEAVRKDGRFKEVITFEAKDYWGNVRKTVLFEYVGKDE
ncbi:hypothetical protein IQ13_2237 [Lacibacter cauensis]|uniref:Dolichyl-phosphate-mannose-protein mannosyltransferase n=1 Tax=Lacibacter cauensis TaxID=510947 RepID=A0A562SIX6_9BACT|nr:hypothetical protein [Lacibacter cauensis]TWI81221.1 hypothetical protein IQ13_2237 [Lacibacter cauensis]